METLRWDILGSLAVDRRGARRSSQRVSNYQLVYDATDAGFTTWPFAAAGLIFVFAGVIAFLLNRNPSTPRERVLRKVVAPILVVIGSWFSIGTLSALRSEHRRVSEALLHHQYELVEGPVTVIAAGSDGHPPETWKVGSHSYEVNPSEISSGFTKDKVMSSGTIVRIADVEGKIARLEIRK